MSAFERPSAQRFISSTLSKVKVEVWTTGVATGPPTPRWTSPACTAVVAAPTDLLLARLLVIPLSSVGQTFLLALSLSKGLPGRNSTSARVPRATTKLSPKKVQPSGRGRWAVPFNQSTDKPVNQK